MTTNARERFLQIARFERPNDPFMFGLRAWNETYRRWIREGMPAPAQDREVNVLLLGYQDEIESGLPNAALVGLGANGNPPWAPPLVPYFEPKVLRDEDTHEVKVAYDGAIVRVMKGDPEAMPQWISYPVQNREGWEDYKRRLDPASPERFPNGWDMITDDKLGWPIRDEMVGKPYAERDFPLRMSCLSLFGIPRNILGLENISYAIYDDPGLVEDMIEWQAHLGYELVKKVLAAGIVPDYAWIWEDMAHKRGSLVSPAFVKQHMAPHYRRVVDLLRGHGVDIIILDSDGNIDELIPIWLDCGINGFYPLEVASDMDGLALRKRYGKNLIITGHVDKRMLAKGKREIDGELEKVRTLLKYGGYFPSCDHHVPPDVPYRNIVYFLNELRKMSAYEETRRVIDGVGELDGRPGGRS